MRLGLSTRVSRPMMKLDGAAAGVYGWKSRLRQGKRLIVVR